MAQTYSFKAVVISAAIFTAALLVFPIANEVMRFFVFNTIESLYPDTYQFIYLGVFFGYIAFVMLASIGLIKINVPKKLRFD
jgi:hypothetical protein